MEQPTFPRPRRSRAERHTDPVESFMAKFEVDTGTGCWPWTAATTASGYGVMNVARRWVRAHRFAYELWVGPIPDGLVIDHMCRVRHCVNPDHLQAITHAENIGLGHRRMTHCKHGHPFDDENTIWYTRKGYSEPYRRCRECQRRYSAEAKLRGQVPYWKRHPIGT